MKWGIRSASDDKATAFLKQDVIMIHIRSIIAMGDPNYDKDAEYQSTCLEVRKKVVVIVVVVVEKASRNKVELAALEGK